MVEIIVWFSILVLLIVGEAMTVGLTFIWFAVGAVGALIAALLHCSVLVQILVFLVLSGLTLILVRPIAVKFFQSKISPTNTDLLIGKTALVTQSIDNMAGEGQVSISGQVWAARSEHNMVIPADTTVKILRIEGVKVFVESI